MKNDNKKYRIKIKHLLWILEHSNLYSAGTSAKETDLLNKINFLFIKLIEVDNGHFMGDGQKIYFAIDLTQKILKNLLEKLKNG